ncbi:MAG: rod shape-determining protein MreD [Legionellales bacterium]|nr:rod shape-determining protein MreD [Legionellales bacterium]
MTHPRSIPYGLILLSLFVALLLGILPMPLWSVWYRPEWMALVILYWVMVLPETVNIGVAWLMGIVLDALNGTLLGEHALALAAIAFIMDKWQRQVRLFPVWQSAVIVGVLIAIYKLIIGVIQGLVGQPPDSVGYAFSIGTSVLLWPWLQAVLAVRESYGAQE